MNFQPTTIHAARRARLVATFWAALAVAQALAGCSAARPEAIVPVLKDAAAQYAYANHYREKEARIELITDRARYLRARDVVMQTYQKVIDYFPKDHVYAPLAELDLIAMRCGFDTDRLKYSKSQYRRILKQAIADIQKVMKENPDYPYVQAKGLFLGGRCHLMLKDYRSAQAEFRQAREQFGNSGNPKIKALADAAALYYKQVYIAE